jgi:hypothetical protein
MPCQGTYQPEETGYDERVARPTIGRPCENDSFDFTVSFPGNYPGDVSWANLTSAVQSTLDRPGAVLGGATQNIEIYGLQVGMGLQTTYVSYESEMSAAMQASNLPSVPVALLFAAPGKGDADGHAAAESVSPVPTELQYVSGSSGSP